MKKKFRSFEEARKFVQSLGIKREHDWRKFCKSNNKPEDIPFRPDYHYKKDWKGMGDWLGTGRIANQNKKFLTYTQAKKRIKQFNIKGANEWEEFCKSGKKPSNIPASPNKTYKNNSWKSWGDWLGTRSISPSKKKFRLFNESRKYVRKMKIASQTEWTKWCSSGKKPSDVPSSPPTTYKKEWKSWGDWLGTFELSAKQKSENWIPYSDAEKIYKKLAKKHRIKNWADWTKFTKTNKLPPGLPKYPWEIYTKENVLKRWKKN